MAAGSVLSRELRSLQEELANRRRERSAPAAAASPEPATAEAAADPVPDSSPEAGEEADFRALLADFVDEIAGYIGQAEKNIAAHPAGSVVGALFVGIVIGRLLGRR